MTTFYGTVVGGTDYLSERGIVGMITEPDLVVASEWLDNKYGSMFSGEKTGLRSQEREQPRTSQYDRDGNSIGVDEIPIEVIRATYELAYRNNAAPGSLVTDGSMATSIKSATVFGAVAVTYAGASDIMDMQLVIPIVGMILAPILTGQGDFASLSVPSRRV